MQTNTDRYSATVYTLRTVGAVVQCHTLETSYQGNPMCKEFNNYSVIASSCRTSITFLYTITAYYNNGAMNFISERLTV